MPQIAIITTHITQMARDMHTLCEAADGKNVEFGGEGTITVPEGFFMKADGSPQTDVPASWVVDRIETLAHHVLSEMRDERDRTRGWRDPR